MGYAAPKTDFIKECEACAADLETFAKSFLSKGKFCGGEKLTVADFKLAPFLFVLALPEMARWAANKRFKILKFKFKFPIARTFELLRARSRLHRSHTLQVNTRWKALDKIYIIYMLLHRSAINVSANFRRLKKTFVEFLSDFAGKFAKFAFLSQIRHFSCFMILTT